MHTYIYIYHDLPTMPIAHHLKPTLMDVYIGNIVHTPAAGQVKILVDHAIGVDHNGSIAFVRPKSQYDRNTEDNVTQLSSNQFLIPGFIDAHAHAPQFPNCGIFGSSTLLDWLTTYTFPLEARYKDIDFAKKVYARVVERQLECGTTTTSYFGTIHVDATVELARICLEKSQRAQVGRVCMERFCPEDVQDGKIESDREFADALHKLDSTGEHVRAVITPRFAPSCEFSTLKELGKFAKERNLPVQTHISENKDEIKWVQTLFPDHANYTDVYDMADLLKHDTVLAHGIHLTEPEIKVIDQRKSGIAHCPNSNASVRSGIAPVKRYLNRGLKVGLGSDISGGSTVSILRNLRLALHMSRLLSERNNGTEDVLSVNDGLFLATLGGAQVLDMQDRIGSFEVGKQFDAQLVDPYASGSAIDEFEECSSDKEFPDKVNHVETLLQKWVYIGDERNTLKVWVDGKMVHERKIKREQCS